MGDLVDNCIVYYTLHYFIDRGSGTIVLSITLCITSLIGDLVDNCIVYHTSHYFSDRGSG